MKPHLLIEQADDSNAAELVSLATTSWRLHRPWVYLQQHARGWVTYLDRCRTGAVIGYLLRDPITRELVGVVNISEIVRGVFQSAYLGFYVHAAHARRGIMTVGLDLVLRKAFVVHRLHRLEANLQPRNKASRLLVQRLGFRKEGFSPRYLKIGGRWRDHERWAITREDWRARRRGGRAR
jgi:ribosomal-protein-alanine N-acetyltransferase